MARLVLFESTIHGTDFSITDNMALGDVVWLSWNDNDQWKTLDSHYIDEGMDVTEWLQTLCDRVNTTLDRFFDDHDGTPEFGDWQEEAKYRISNSLTMVDGQLVIK